MKAVPGFDAVKPPVDARARRRLCRLLLAASLAVSACATPTPPHPAPGGHAVPPDFWSGRFALTWSENSYQASAEHASGRFELMVRDGHTLLDLTSPLGQTIARITIAPNEATLILDDGSRHRASRADILTEQMFGWKIPLVDLPRWFTGQIAEPRQVVDGRVMSGTDHGWQVRFEAFTDDRPRTIALEWPVQADASLQRIELRLVVDQAERLGQAERP